jgi:FtsP/CotA-like multicopper oxidase with cupredoxin domain
MATFIWHRRSRVALLAALVSALIFAPSGMRSTSPVLATSGGDPYSVPQIVDTNPDPDIVETTITASAEGVDIGGGVMASVLTYNGTVPGPEFRLKVGDTVIVHFKNEIAHATGIHWHGIELANASDGTPLSQNQVPPGDTFIYKFTVSRPGIYWYHPHHHSSTNQVFKGMYGSIIVEDPHEAALQASGAIPGAADTRTIALSDMTVCKAVGDNDTVTYDPTLPHVSGGALPGQPGPSPFDLCEGAPLDEDGNPRPAFGAGDVPNIQQPGTAGRVNEGQTVLTNGMNVGGRAGTPAAPGALAPGAHTLDVLAGQGLRLQLANTATTRFFRLLLTDNAGTQIPLVRIGGQGGLLDDATIDGGVVSGFDFNYTAGEILLDPGDRQDVVAAIPAAATGVLTLWTQDFDRTGAGFANIPTVPIAHFNVAGVAASVYTIGDGTDLRSSIPGAGVEVLGPATGTLLDPTAFAPAKPGMASQDVQLTAVGGVSLGVNGVIGHHDFAGDYTAAPHEASARYAKIGDILELTTTNTTNAHHPFHLHGFSIQPIELTKAASPTFTFPRAEYRDNIDIPKGYTLRYRVRLDDRALMDGSTSGGGLGRWVFHCHIFFHAVFGMISEFVVTSPDGKERPYVNANDTLIEAITGQNVAMNGTFVDTDGEAVTLSASIGTVVDNGDGTWTWTYTTLGGDSQYVFITATDAGGRQDQAIFELEVNSPPVVTVDNASGNEGGNIPIHATAVDPDGDPVTTTWSFAPGVGVDAGATCAIAAPNSLDTTINCTDDGTFTITLTASDGINAPVAVNATLTVANVPPTVMIGSPPSGSVFIIGSTVSIVASITDPGSNDTLSCTFTWDGGGPNDVVVPVAGTCSASNTFNTAGVFTSTVTGSDDDGGTDVETVVIVVFNPESKVTGGGTINSPAGAVVAAPALTGTAHFNLNPRYLQDDLVPSGQGKFRFQAAGIDFDSTALEYLVVTGSKGQLRGSGTINGGGSYGFLMTVVDGKLPGSGGADRFRMKIWNKLAGDAVVYDNVPGAPDDIDIANPAPTSGGNITIHKEK